MFDNLHKITDLFAKSFSGTLDGNERDELDSILSDDAMYEAYRQLEDDEFISSRLCELARYPCRPAFEKLLAIRRRRIIRRRIAAAASTVAAAIIVFAAVTLNRPHDDTDFLSEKPAGRAIAQLTLDDGRTVAIEGNSAVLPEELDGKAGISENGELVYNAEATGNFSQSHHNIYVPVGGEYKVRLDDGTGVWLNADSRLSYPVAFGEGERRVKLSGEAYFDVTHDERRTFVVETASGEVRVLGTSFGVAVYPGETGYATLVEGRVNFSSPAGEVVLSPGEQAVFTPDGRLSKRNVNVDEYVGWVYGEFIFRDKPLGEIMQTLSRWYDVGVEFSDPFLSDIRYSGNLRRYDSINTFIELLIRLNDLECRMDRNTIFLYR